MIIPDNEYNDDSQYDSVNYTDFQGSIKERILERSLIKDVMENPYYDETENIINDDNSGGISPQRNDPKFSPVTVLNNVYYEK